MSISTTALPIVDNIIYSILGVGLIFLICSFFSTSNMCNIVAYISITTSIILLFATLLYRIFTINNNASILKTIFSLFPLVVLIGILIYSLYLFIRFNSKIANGNTTSLFGTLTKTSMFLLFVELGLLYYGSQKESFKKTAMFDNVFSSMLMLIELLNIIILVYLGITLMYFTTDG